MNNEVREANRQEDKKAKKSFWIFVLIGGLVGGFAGFISAWIEDVQGLTAFVQGLEAFVYGISNYVGLVSGTITAIVIIVLYKKARKEFAGWDGEDDIIENRIESKLSFALILANGNLILSYIFLPIGFVKLINMIEKDMEWKGFLIQAGIHGIGAILCMVVAMMASAKIVNLVKEMNPEKQGSAYDMNFQKKWLKSSDEAEKLTIYKAGYMGYTVSNATCLILWMTCLFGMLFGDWGLVPVFMIGIIWISSYIGYNVEAMRLSKDASRIQE